MFLCISDSRFATIETGSSIYLGAFTSQTLEDGLELSIEFDDLEMSV